MNRKAMIEAINTMRAAAGHAPIDGKGERLVIIKMWHHQHTQGIF
ncbi:hypothetical protein DLP05_037 [Stenotrophomonas phage vB_SmaS_DLP_5]|uniref:Uncharacterized protein n=1 Tax=Stenotrophomonas phage vB_SmaS_DLP_5 TaxID=2044561 RepID=A0A2D2W2Q9_9CAUD|nr:hypothetical protein FDJ07_gp036 [Stenotrophomonas phage vB_SmaS_DLP_5]ATS92413.1 hypothetical protein DLP05_037 [Stenotrophomonas phage vB_SmaS_DLP_5]